MSREFWVSLGGLAAATALAACGEASPTVDDWRALTAQETAAVDKESLAQNPYLKSAPIRVVEGDFDGDGKADRAAIWVKGDKFALFLLPAGKAPMQLSEPQPRSGLPNIELGTIAPGEHATACGKGQGADAEPCAPKVTLSTPGVVYTTLESASSVYFWNGKTFQEAWLSD